MSDRVLRFARWMEAMHEGEEEANLTGCGLAFGDVELVRILAQDLKTNNTLLTLDLYGNMLGDDGVALIVEALKSNSVLTTLCLGGNPIGIAGVHAIAGLVTTNETLMDLDLAYTAIEDEGVRVLAEAFKVNKTLRVLNFKDCRFGYNGVLALLDALKTNNKICKLYLGRISSDKLESLLRSNLICRALEDNRTLSVVQSLDLPRDVAVHICAMAFRFPPFDPAVDTVPVTRAAATRLVARLTEE